MKEWKAEKERVRKKRKRMRWTKRETKKIDEIEREKRDRDRESGGGQRIVEKYLRIVRRRAIAGISECSFSREAFNSRRSIQCELHYRHIHRRARLCTRVRVNAARTRTRARRAP